MTTTTLTQHETVTQIVRTYEEARADIESAFGQVSAAVKRLNDTFSHSEHAGDIFIRDRWRGHANVSFDEPGDVLEMLKRDVWRCIVDRLEIQRVCSIARWTEITRQLESGEGLPELTVDNVMRWGQAQHRAIPEMIEEAVREVFDLLRPPGSTYKTNTEYEIGKRVILERAVEAGWGRNGGFMLCYRKEQHIIALENVMQALDGRGFVNKNNRSELYQALRDAPNGRGRTTYYKFRAFKKGTLHLEFTRPELVKRLNAIAGGKRLRATG